MNNRLFSLPEHILSDIYTMDSTYRDKIQNEIKTEILKSSWNTFRREFISHSIFKNEHITIRKFDLLIKYLQNTWVSFKFIPSSDITITTSWKIMTYDNYHIDYNDDYLYEDDLLVEEPLMFIVSIRGLPHSEIEGVIYTSKQFSQYSRYYDNNLIEIGICQNDEFIIVKCIH